MTADRSDRSLASALRRLAEDDVRHGASTDVRARLLVEVRTIAIRRRRRLYTAGALGLLAASVVALVLVSRDHVSRTARPVEDTRADVREAVTEFLPLPHATIAASDVHIVRVEVPREAMATFGFGQAETPAMPDTPETVLADLLVGEDGLARAVRFVHPIAHQE